MKKRFIKDKVILVTGGAGFIGSHLVDRMIEIGAKHIIVIDNLFCGSELNISNALKSGKVTFYRDDAEFNTSLSYIFNNHKIDIVFNCATKALNYSFINPLNSFDTNVRVALNLLEFLRYKKFKTLCHISTSEVYGTAIYEPMDENHPKSPTTTYAAGKASADLAVESYVRMFDVDAFIVRPFNNYGPRQNYKGLLAGVIPITIWRILNNQKPQIHGDGKQSRDFIFVKDTVSLMIKMFCHTPQGESLNISANNQITIRNLVTKICLQLGYSGKIETKAERFADVKCHNGSSKKAQSFVEYVTTPFDQGIKETIEWYKKRVSSIS